MKKVLLAVLIGCVCATGTFFLLHEPDTDQLKFELGAYDVEPEEKAVLETIRLFNKHYATFFDTGGNTRGLNEFPAANMVKRRIFQDIGNWKDEGNVLVYDKFDVKPVSTKLLSPSRAVVVTQEVWALMLKEGEVRSKGTKSLAIKVRYILSKIRQQWVVEEFEVYGPDDELPPLADVWKD